MDEQTRADATAYLAALVDAEPQSDWGRPNERTMYQLPGDRLRLMALLRSGGELPGVRAIFAGWVALFQDCQQ